jgi:hypothetical protein
MSYAAAAGGVAASCGSPQRPRQPPQPPPKPPSDHGHAKAEYRGHRERGEAIAGHHADRPGDARSGPSQAGPARPTGTTPRSLGPPTKVAQGSEAPQ